MAPEVVLAEYKDSEQPYYDQKIDVWAVGKFISRLLIISRFEYNNLPSKNLGNINISINIFYYYCSFVLEVLKKLG